MINSVLTSCKASCIFGAYLAAGFLNNMTETTESSVVLQHSIEQAIRLGDSSSIARAVQRELAKILSSGQFHLADRFCRISPGSYARRPLLREQKKGYSVVVMTWAPGQATPIHDHAGIWCVEGVVQGEINVNRYKLERRRGELFLFSSQVPIRAPAGSTGSLIPPDEYHVLENVTDSVTITLHVYGGEMDHCNVYTPRSDGWHERMPHELSYDP